MGNEITFTPDAAKALKDLLIAKTARPDLRNLAAKIEDENPKEGVIPILTEDEFVEAIAGNAKVTKLKDPEGVAPGTSARQFAKSVFGYLKLSTGKDLEVREVVDVWQFLSRGDTEGLAAPTPELADVKDVFTFPKYSSVGKKRPILPWGAKEPVGDVEATRATVPFVELIETDDVAEGALPVHHLKCVMTVDAKKIGLTKQEFYNFIISADQYTEALTAQVTGMEISPAELDDAPADGGKFYYSDFKMIPSTHGQNVMLMKGNGVDHITWSTRVRTKDKLIDLNAFADKFKTRHSFHTNINVAGSWQISGSDQGLITIEYSCALQTPDGIGTGEGAVTNFGADVLILMTTTQIFSDIFEKMGSVYVELKKELATRKKATDFASVTTHLKKFYDKTVNVAENIAAMHEYLKTI